MRPTLLSLLPSALLLLSITATAASQPDLHTSTIYHHPFSASTPTPLATIAFNPLHPHLSTIESFKAPKPSKNDDDTTRIAVALGEKARYRSTLVDLKSLREGRGRFRISVSEEGVLAGAGWHPTASVPVKEKENKVDGKGEFDMLVTREGPKAMVDQTLPAAKGKKKAEVAGQNGEEGEEEVEKTFLQK